MSSVNLDLRGCMLLLLLLLSLGFGGMEDVSAKMEGVFFSNNENRISRYLKVAGERERVVVTGIKIGKSGEREREGECETI